MSWNTCLHLTPFPLFLLELPLSTISSPPALPAPPSSTPSLMNSEYPANSQTSSSSSLFPKNGEGPKNLSRGLTEQPTGEQVSRVYLEAPVGSVIGILGRVRVKSSLLFQKTRPLLHDQTDALLIVSVQRSA